MLPFLAIKVHFSFECKYIIVSITGPKPTFFYNPVNVSSQILHRLQYVEQIYVSHQMEPCTNSLPRGPSLRLFLPSSSAYASHVPSNPWVV